MNPLKLLTPNRRRVVIAKLRKQDEAEPKGYDLCYKVNDAYVDVCQRYDNTWSVSVAGQRLAEAVESRTKCIDILEKL